MDLRPGDVIIANDPYAGGGTHLSDVALVRPIFAGSEAARADRVRCGQGPLDRGRRQGPRIVDRRLAGRLRRGSAAPVRLRLPQWRAAARPPRHPGRQQSPARHGPRRPRRPGRLPGGGRTPPARHVRQVRHGRRAQRDEATLDRSERLCTAGPGRIPHGVFDGRGLHRHRRPRQRPVPRSGPRGDHRRRRDLRLHRQSRPGARARSTAPGAAWSPACAPCSRPSPTLQSPRPTAGSGR